MVRKRKSAEPVFVDSLQKVKEVADLVEETSDCSYDKRLSSEDMLIIDRYNNKLVEVLFSRGLLTQREVESVINGGVDSIHVYALN